MQIKKKTLKIRILFWVIVAVLLLIITLFSSQSSSDSKELSRSVSILIGGEPETKAESAEKTTVETVYSSSAEDGKHEDKSETEAEADIYCGLETTETTSESESPKYTMPETSGSVINSSSPKIIKYIQMHLRKLAHDLLFFTLGIFTFLAAYFEFGLKIFSFIFTSIFGVAVAALDEIHQSFVPGRSMLVEDIIRDSISCAIAALVVLVIITIYQIIKINKQKEKKNAISEKS